MVCVWNVSRDVKLVPSFFGLVLAFDFLTLILSQSQQGDWSRFAYPVQRSYGKSVDEWSDQPLVPASFFRYGTGLSREPYMYLIYVIRTMFLHRCRTLVFELFYNFHFKPRSELRFR